MTLIEGVWVYECVSVCMCMPTCVCMCVCFQNMGHYWEKQKHSGSIHSHIRGHSELRLGGSASLTLLLLGQSAGVVKSIMNSMSSELRVQVHILPFACFVDMMTVIKPSGCEALEWTKTCLDWTISKDPLNYKCIGTYYSKFITQLSVAYVPQNISSK